jgi:hypothetical protein
MSLPLVLLLHLLGLRVLTLQQSVLMLLVVLRVVLGVAV